MQEAVESSRVKTSQTMEIAAIVIREPVGQEMLEAKSKRDIDFDPQ
jgi:hypothetical protein